MSSADLAATTGQTQTQTQAQAFDVMATIRNPLTWTIVSAAAFISTFGAVIQTSDSITRIDQSILRVWWVGTILSSFVFLLLFFLVFRSSEYFNTAVITLLFGIFVITHVSLLLTQINLRV